MLGRGAEPELLVYGRGRRRRPVTSYAPCYDDEDNDELGPLHATRQRSSRLPQASVKSDDRQKMMRRKRAGSVCSMSTSSSAESEASENELIPERPTVTAGAEAPGGTERLLMRAWLVQQVETGTIPGLQYHNRENKLIRIPWVHASRQCWEADRHSELFRRWAIHTGRFNPNHENAKKWKANFRCALNSLPDVKEERTLRKKGQHAYKVYRLHSPTRRETILLKRSKPHERRKSDSLNNSNSSVHEDTVAMDVDDSCSSQMSAPSPPSTSPPPRPLERMDTNPDLASSPAHDYTQHQPRWLGLPLPVIESFDDHADNLMNVSSPQQEGSPYSDEQYRTVTEILICRFKSAPEASFPELLPEIVDPEVQLTELKNVHFTLPTLLPVIS